jgi:hypothetical protein
MTSPNVFVSYAHDSEEHKQRTLELADRLNAEGINCWIDRYIEGSDPEHGWPAWMDEKIRQSDFVLVVASERYLARYEHRETDGKGLGAKFESLLLLQEIFDNDSKNLKYIPILFDKEDKKHILTPLRPWTYFSVFDENDYEKLYRRITNQIKISKPPVGKIKSFSKEDDSATVVAPELEGIIIVEIPELPQFTNDMQPGTKILNAFFSLPKTRRFAIASELKLVEEGESVNDNNTDKTSADFLIRAKEKGLLAELWTKLFDETIDPNPFKKKI